MDGAAGITSPELVTAQEAVEKAREGIRTAQSELDAKNKLDQATTKFESATTKVNSLKAPPPLSPEEQKLIDAQKELQKAQETVTAEQDKLVKNKQLADAEAAAKAAEATKLELEKPATKPEKEG
jgi:hypothetical protein